MPKRPERPAAVPQDLHGLLAHIGLTNIRARGEEVWASCPSHKDSGDSWSMNAKTGLHRCFGCGYAGSLQSAVMDTLDIDNFVANRLIRSFGLAEVLDADTLYELREPAHHEPAPLAPTVRFRTFTEVPEGVLANKQISPASARHFDIRWETDTSSWALPIKSPGGVFLGYQSKGPGRVVRTLPPGIKKKRTVFGAEHLVRCKTVIIVESPLDVAVLHTLGYESAIATFGAVVADEQIRLVRDYAEEIILALDNDAAGLENMARIAGGVSYNQRGQRIESTPWMDLIPMKIIKYWRPSGSKPKDIGEMTPAESAWALDNAVPALGWALTIERMNRRVHRPVAPIPGRSRRTHGGQPRDPGRLLDGAGQNSGDHRSS